MGDRDIDYAVAEYLLNWEKIYVENIVDFEGNGWELPSGQLISADDTPFFTKDMREALNIYSIYKDEIDKLWEMKKFKVNAESLCVAALSVNGIKI
jgi:hypothetical protein